MGGGHGVEQVEEHMIREQRYIFEVCGRVRVTHGSLIFQKVLAMADFQIILHSAT